MNAEPDRAGQAEADLNTRVVRPRDASLDDPLVRGLAEYGADSEVKARQRPVYPGWRPWHRLDGTPVWELSG